MNPPELRTPGPLVGKVTVLDDVTPARRDRIRPQTFATLLSLAPATVLLAALIAWPVLRTVQASLTDPDGRLIWLGNFRAAFTDGQVRPALLRTVLWAVLVPVLVIGLGYLLAVLSRRVRGGRLIVLALVLPMALPLLVTGVAFRLLYDPSPERQTVTAALRWGARLVGADPARMPALLGPTLITPALMSAFVWGFLGLVVVVFRVVLASIPPDREDMVRAEGGRWVDVFRDVRWPVLRRVTVVLFVVVALATARSFDLLLVMAPASVQNDGQVLSLYLWRATPSTTSGPAAAVSVLWLLVVGLAVGVAFFWNRAVPGLHVPIPDESYRAATMSARPLVTRARLILSRVLAVLATAVWLAPVLLLAVTSLHGTTAAASRGWDAGLTGGQYPATWRRLAGTLGGTAFLALTVTVVVLSIAMLAAYALVVFRPLRTRLAGAVLVGCAVVPVQTITGPINEVLGPPRLAGTGLALFLVHVALGVPLTTLLLRNAFEQLQLHRDRDAGPVRHPARAGVDPGTRSPRQVLMVAARPAVYAAAVLEFVQVWNDLVVGLLFGGAIAPAGVTLFGQAREFASNAGALAAGSILVSALPLVLILVVRRKIVDLMVYGVLTR